MPCTWGEVGIDSSCTDRAALCQLWLPLRPRTRVPRPPFRLGRRHNMHLPRPVYCSTLNGATPIVTPGNQQFHDANFPTDDQGRTYHLGTKRGEVAPRILSVGAAKRAEMLAEYLEPPAPGRPVFFQISGRGFETITGRYHGVPISIVTTHMGMPNMDFVVRECRAVVAGPMAILRLGTCGSLQAPARLGSLVVASQGSVAIRRDPDGFDLSGEAEPILPYQISKPVPANEQLSQLLVSALTKRLGPEHVLQGMNASADSFYSSQGRIATSFDDHNEGLLAQLASRHPALLSLEMETFHLLDLARCSRGSIAATAAAIVLAERQSNAFIAADQVERIEREAGQACLAALAAYQLPGGDAESTDADRERCVWL